jgi:hypothetical protein
MKQNSKYKKPSIPNYNPQVIKPGQISRATANAVKAAQSKTNAGSFNIRKSQ